MTNSYYDEQLLNVMRSGVGCGRYNEYFSCCADNSKDPGVITNNFFGTLARRYRGVPLLLRLRLQQEWKNGLLVLSASWDKKGVHKRIRFVKSMVHWYQWYDWYQSKMTSFQCFYWWICISLRGLRLFSMWSNWVQGNFNGPLVPMVRLVPMENHPIPMVPLVNMHLIKEG